MRCGACGCENRAGRRFCSGCGKPLSAICPACGFENQGDDSFCGGCGVGLVQVQPEKPRENLAELRPVAVLFADLTGFTTLAGRLDPDDARDLLNGVFAIADKAVVEAGGKVDKHIGDCVMAVFGAPVAHDDDPCRAAAAALAIRTKVRAFAEGNGHAGLAMHAGIACGLVLAAETGSSLYSAYTMTGQPVNLAARLCDLAEAGEILVSEEVADAVAATFEVEPRGPGAIDGFDHPVALWSLSAPREREHEAPQIPLVGRETELRQILAALDSCLDSCRGQIVRLRGDAGIGKSRLADEIVRLARTRGFASVRAANLSFGAGQDRHVARVLLGRLLGIDREDDATVWEEALSAAVRQGRIHAAEEGLAYDIAGLPVPGGALSLFHALDAAGRRRGRGKLLADVLAASASAGPMLVVIEDLHWAEPDIVELAGRLAGVARELPVILLLTSRREGDPLDASWRSTIACTPFASFDLAPLAVADAARLARAVMAADAATIDGIVGRAGGNPLFLIQLLHHVVGAREGALPTSIRSLIVARLDRLGERERQAIQAASVLGPRFRAGEVAHLLHKPDIDCASLIAANLVRPADGAFEFTHALIRDAIYDTLPKARRRELHASAARWSEGGDPLLFAQHLDQAGDARAPSAYHEAAKASFGALRHEEAARENARGLELAPSGPERRALTLQRAEILAERGDIAQSLEAWREALSSEDATAAETVRSLIGIAHCNRIVDRLSEAEEALARAEAIALSNEMTLDCSHIHFLRGNLLFPQGNIDACLVEHQKALALAREAGSAEAEARALGGLGDAFYALGHMESAYQAFSNCVELARRNALGRIEIANMPMAGFTALFGGRFREAAKLAEDTVDLARKTGMLRSEMIGWHAVFWIAIEEGDASRARRAVERAEEIAQGLGARRFQAENLAFIAQVSLIEGDRAGALAQAREAWRLAEETGPAYIGAVALAEIAAAADDEAEWDEAIRRAERLLAQGVLSHNYFIFYRRAMETGLDRGRFADVVRWADALERRFAEEPNVWTRFFAEWGRALAARGQGGRNDAELERLIRQARAMSLNRAAEFAERRLLSRQA